MITSEWEGMCSKFVSVAAADNKDEDNLYSLSPHSLPPIFYSLKVTFNIYKISLLLFFFLFFFLLFVNFVCTSQL